MNDVCACEWEPDEIATVYERVERRARKRHQCVECDHCILPGQQYTEIRMLFEGQWTTDRICETCRRVGDDLCCGAWPLAALWEHIRESAFEAWAGDDEEDDDWDWCEPGSCTCSECAVTKQRERFPMPDPRPAPDFEGFAAQLVEEARWIATIHRDDMTGQAVTEEQALLRLSRRVLGLGRKLGFVPEAADTGQ